MKYNHETFSYDIKKDPYLEIDFEEIYGEGDSMDNVFLYIEKNNLEEIRKEQESPLTFRFDIDFRGLSETRKIEVDMINKFDKFPMKGKVDIKNSERIFIIFRNTVENQKTKKIISTKYYFGRKFALDVI